MTRSLDVPITYGDLDLIAVVDLDPHEGDDGRGCGVQLRSVRLDGGDGKPDATFLAMLEEDDGALVQLQRDAMRQLAEEQEDR